MARFFVPLAVSSAVLTLLCTTIIQLSTGAYVEQFLESVEVCTTGAVGPFSNLAKKKIRLGNYPNNTVMFKLTRWEQFWPSFLNFRCKFQVIAPKKYGVMVTIQSMHLRSKSSLNSCRDYLKFEQEDGFKTGQICGDLSEDESNVSPVGLIGKRYFADNSGQIDVTFSTDDKDPPSEQNHQPVFLKMIFTAYNDCSDMEVSTGKLKRCSTTKSQSCIASNLFCDGEINCSTGDSDFGIDEKFCDDSRNLEKSSTYSHEGRLSFYIFTVTCIFFVILVAFIAWYCALRSNARRRSRNDDIPLPFQQHNIFQTSIEGSTDVVVSEDKKPTEDLPPAYDALFPVNNQSEKKTPENKSSKL